MCHWKKWGCRYKVTWQKNWYILTSRIFTILFQDYNLAKPWLGKFDLTWDVTKSQDCLFSYNWVLWAKKRNKISNRIHSRLGLIRSARGNDWKSPSQIKLQFSTKKRKKKKCYINKYIRSEENLLGNTKWKLKKLRHHSSNNENINCGFPLTAEDQSGCNSTRQFIIFNSIKLTSFFSLSSAVDRERLFND